MISVEPPAPWEVPPPWAVEAERANPAARWSLGLGIASVVPGVGLGAVVAGTVGLVRAHRAGGAGRRLAAVGLALGAGFLLADTALVGAGVAHEVVALTSSSSSSDDGADGGSGGGPPDPDDRTSSDLSAQEQAYIDALDDVTYLNFNDETLLEMGRRACSDLSAGRSSEDDADRLNDTYGAGTGDAWDVQQTATQTLCPENADRLSQESSTTT